MSDRTPHSNCTISLHESINVNLDEWQCEAHYTSNETALIFRRKEMVWDTMHDLIVSTVADDFGRRHHWKLAAKGEERAVGSGIDLGQCFREVTEELAFRQAEQALLARSKVEG